ncbi:MAG: protein kinase domain-containing protein [Pyrinomonadaceae bacterium]
MTPERWRQIEELFQSALSRPADERASFLRAACAGDEPLRLEVEALLKSHDDAGSFINAPALTVAAEHLADERAHALAGRAVGHYKILELIGAGGMGEVYLAEDINLGRKAALKLLPATFTRDEARVRRFRQEARAASALNHPNILTIYEIGEADGTQFIATEYILGETLRERMARAPLGLPEALDVAAQVAGALSAAHASGIAHRDIKPENVMLRPDGYLKILDFGLAKLTERRAITNEPEAPTKVNVNTAPGVVMGTVSYMSPEQGRGLRVDARTDVWSLGVVLYELVAGRVPFEGETPSDAIAALLKAEPPLLSRYAPDAPAELQRIVSKSLRKDREERYQTIKDMALDLRELRDELAFAAKLERSVAPGSNNGAPTAAGGGQATAATSAQSAANTSEAAQAHTTSSAEYLVGEVRRHKRAFAVAALLFLSAAVAGGYWFFTRHSANTEQIESVAVLPFANEGGNADVEYLSDGMTETLIGSLSQIPKLSVKARNSTFRYKGRETDLQKIAQELNVQAILTGRVVERGEELLLSLELVDAKTENVIWSEQYTRRQADLLSLQSEVARDVSSKLRTKLSGADERKVTKSYTADPEAYQLYLQGRYHWNKRTEAEIKKSIDYFNQAIARDPNYALAYAALAQSYVVLPEYSNTLPTESFPKAKAAAQKALDIDDTLGEALLTLAVDKQDYDPPAAVRDFQKVIALDPNNPTAHQWYGEFLGLEGRMDESIAEMRRALELDPLSLIINKQLGTSLLFAHRYDESIEQEKKVLEMDASFAPAYRDLGWCYTKKGMYDEAIASFQKAMALGVGDAAKPPGLAYALAKSGRRGEAQKILEEMKERQKREHVDAGDFAVIHTALGDKDEAFADLEKAYKEHSRWMGYLKVDPALDDLRDDPRFQDLLRRAGPTL